MTTQLNFERPDNAHFSASPIHPVWPLVGSPNDPRLLHADPSDEIYTCPPGSGEGYMQKIALGDDLYLIILDYELYKDLLFDPPQKSELLEFEFCLAGPGTGYSSIVPYFGFRPFGLRRAHGRSLKVEVFFGRPTLTEYFVRVLDRLSPRLHSLAKRFLECLCHYHGNSDRVDNLPAIAERVFTASIPADPQFTLQHVVPTSLYDELPDLGLATCPQAISPAMERVIGEILSCPYRGELRRRYLKNKALELVHLRLEAIVQPSIDNADLESVLQAAQILRTQLAAPPTVESLARQVCLSRSKLHQCFQRVYGVPPFAYLRFQRLWQAQRLLMTSSLSVEQVASTVGYTSRSRFASSFRETFQWSPKMFQLRVRSWGS